MQTDFGSLTTQQKKLWSAYVFKAGRDQSFFLGEKGMMGEGLRDATKPIHYVDQLTQTEKGDKCVLPIVLDLQNDGIAGDNELENQEEALVADDIEIAVDQFRHAVKSKGRMSEQRTVIQFRAQAKDALSFWLSDKRDEMMFLTASGVAYTSKLNGATRGTSQLPSLAFASSVSAPSTNRKVFPGSITTTGSLTSSDKMSWNLLLKTKAKAITKRIKPIRIKGKNTWVVLLHPWQARDLKLDNDYKAIVSQGGNKGDMNPLFTGAIAYVDGLILYEHNKVYNTSGLGASSKWGSGGTVEGAQALLLGAQALGYAEIKDPEWNESDNQDYGNKQGLAYSQMIGIVKTKFKSVFDSLASEDFSIISIYTAAAE
jgi:N4-gp56 family major capsid protein